jgi:galactokinase
MQQNDHLDALVQAAEQRFVEKLKRTPRWIVAAPGRVNLIGEHTDYNGGFVFPMAIDRYTVIAADRANSETAGLNPDCARVYSTELDRWATVLVGGAIEPGEGGWASYVQGTVAGCLDKGLAPGSFEAIIHSDVPVGGGLSSSAALEVATATLVEAITGKRLEPIQKVLLCQKAEHDYAGMPCGIMDQFTSVMAKKDCLMLLDCRSQSAEMVPLSDPDIEVLIANTNVKHELTGGEYAERRGQCEEAARILAVDELRDATLDKVDGSREDLDNVHFRRARHVIGEIDRTVQAADAMKRNDWGTVGQLMYASHESLRDDYEVSCSELDLLVELARSLGPAGGVIGSRMTGGGFGGCTVSLVREDAVESVTQRLHDRYSRETGIEPSIFATRPARGACIVKAPAP